ncbi:MAG: SAM-dependent DNA methyltransferase [Desulfobacteraceae bacterium]|nr:SAM-dependent DNA methyltransferase [Desulfobacteraceae bacterium]
MKIINNPKLQNLREILDKKYFYKPLYLDKRTQFLSIGIEYRTNIENAICFEVYPGAPFILFVHIGIGELKRVRECALEYALNIETIGVVAFFDDDRGFFEVLRRRFRDGEFETIQGIEYYYKGLTNRSLLPFDKNGKDEKNNDRKSATLIPITNKLENIFFEIHSAMRDIDGLHADAALEELCKLLYLKSHLEEQKASLPIDSVTSESFGTVEEYGSCLRALYREAINYDLRVFRLKIPEYERSRGVFNLPIFLSSAALVKSFHIIEKFSLTQSNADLKGRAFQKVLNKSIRSGMGQYFTPLQVCKLMVEIVSPTSSDLILDPFCGSGHFLTQSLSYVRDMVSDHTKEYHEFAFGKLHGIEKSDRMTRVAMTDMRLNGDGHSNIRCTDSLLDFRNYPDLKPESFDIVLTNPPFGSIFGSEAFSALAKFELAKGRKKVPLDIIGLERAFEFLRPGGRLAIVLPESIFSAESCKHVRAWLLTKMAVRIIIDLPNEAFAPFGANVRSGLLFARKLKPAEKVSSKAKICMIRIDNLGYDASGREIAGSEIIEAARTAKQFIKKEGW